MAEVSTAPADHDYDISTEPRAHSPSPTVSPSRALDAIPHLIRSASTPSDSSASTLSGRSRQSRASDGASSVNRRRGYMRPQGTAFADSARNRDSVMSLGSIAHMQYYFARTGLLDGKGGQLAKDKERKKSDAEKENEAPVVVGADEVMITSVSMHDGQSNYAVSEPGDHVIESPGEIQEPGEYWTSTAEPPMLPPTVSTYQEKPVYVEPLPDMLVLRQEVKDSLEEGHKVLDECRKQLDESSSNDGEQPNGFHEIQGLHVLDVITLAIRAAKNYYTAHTNPQKLYAIRSEKIVRSDLYQVLDTLKRMASRNFRGGVRLAEVTDISSWIESIDRLIGQEEVREKQEADERESWTWREGDWTSREREREWLFLKSFDRDEPVLPRWPESSTDESMPSEFLKALQDGQRLVKLHNTLLTRSKRKFHEIKTWHTDVGKPYRMAENLRYWVKAAELRWEIKITVPVSDVVNSKGPEAWKQFDEAIFEWAKGVRAEMSEEWAQELRPFEPRKQSELKVDVLDTHVEEEESIDQGAPESVRAEEDPVDQIAPEHVHTEEPADQVATEGTQGTETEAVIDHKQVDDQTMPGNTQTENSIDQSASESAHPENPVDEKLEEDNTNETAKIEQARSEIAPRADLEEAVTNNDQTETGNFQQQENALALSEVDEQTAPTKENVVSDSVQSEPTLDTHTNAAKAQDVGKENVPIEVA